MTRTKQLLACALAISSFALPAWADEEITLVLESPKPQAETTSTQSSSRPPQRRGNLPSRSGNVSRNSKEVVVGRLGVIQRPTSIRTGRGTGRTLCKVQAGTYVALTMNAPNHYGVLMADRSVGWIAKRDLNVLHYEVVSNTPNYGTGFTANPALTGGQNQLLQVAYTYLGIPYRYGGTTANGIDCSAFVQQCFRSVGVRLPRTAAEQYAVGEPVTVDQLSAGDRLYFAKSDGRISHTGMYIGSGSFIHASSSRKGVGVSRLDEPMYSRMFVGARR